MSDRPIAKSKPIQRDANRKAAITLGFSWGKFWCKSESVALLADGADAVDSTGPRTQRFLGLLLFIQRFLCRFRTGGKRASPKLSRTSSAQTETCAIRGSWFAMSSLSSRPSDLRGNISQITVGRTRSCRSYQMIGAGKR